MSGIVSGGFGFPADDRIEIPTSFFSGTDDRFVICPEVGQSASHTKHNFRPRGIIFDSNGDDKADDNYATVRGILFGQSDQTPSTRTMARGIVHPRAYKVIFREGTTARGIEIEG